MNTKIIIISLSIVAFLFLSGQKEQEELGASVLRVSQGGTGATSFTEGECLIGAGTGAITTGACGEGGSMTALPTGNIYVGNASNVAVATSTLYITSTGNVGIGTTSPGQKLGVNGVILATGGNSTNWNTAYGWGNHALAGYETQAQASSSFSLLTHNHSSLYDVLGQATSTLASHTTTYNHANYDTAYGWGNHASAGYLTASSTGNLSLGYGGALAKLFLGNIGQIESRINPDTENAIALTSIESIDIQLGSNGFFNVYDSGSNSMFYIDNDLGVTTANKLTVTATGTLNNLAVSNEAWLAIIKSGTWNGSAIDFGSYTNATASNGITISGDNIQPASGYIIPLTASTTRWDIDDPTFTISSTTLASLGSGTTSIPLGVSVANELWQTAYCWTTGGTADVVCGNGTASSTYIHAGTATSSTALNLPLSEGGRRVCDIGNRSSLQLLTCTFKQIWR